MTAHANMATSIARIQAEDDLGIARVIREVLTEFGANREGFAFGDAELDAMSEAYRSPEAAYFVIREEGRVVGGAGFAPLAGGDGATAELRKMYIERAFRGRGYGRTLMNLILNAARTAGYTQLYLETTPEMEQAQRLYERSGFRRLHSPLGDTGHFACQVWYLRPLVGPLEGSAPAPQP